MSPRCAGYQLRAHPLISQAVGIAAFIGALITTEAA